MEMYQALSPNCDKPATKHMCHDNTKRTNQRNGVRAVLGYILMDLTSSTTDSKLLRASVVSQNAPVAFVIPFRPSVCLSV